jgi:Tfp pilus assembly protein PilF
MVRLAPFIFCIFALVFLTQCADKSSDDYAALGISYTNEQKYDEAMEAFLKAIEKDPRNTRAYYGLGGIYNYKKMLPQAEQAFKTAIQLDPTHYNAYYSLGFTYELMGNKVKAEENFQRYRDLKGKLDDIIAKNAK